MGKWDKFASITTGNGSELKCLRLCADGSAIFFAEKMTEADKEAFRNQPYARVVMDGEPFVANGETQAALDITESYAEMPAKVDGDQDMMTIERTDKGLKIIY